MPIADQIGSSDDLLESIEEEIRAELKRRLERLGSVPSRDQERLVSGLTKHVTSFILHTFGGQQIYIKKGGSRRNALIVSEFTGNNHADLARKHGLTIHSIYRILREEKNTDQLSLFTE